MSYLSASGAASAAPPQLDPQELKRATRQLLRPKRIVGVGCLVLLVLNVTLAAVGPGPATAEEGGTLVDGTVAKVVPFGDVDAYVATTDRGTAGPMGAEDDVALAVGDPVSVEYVDGKPVRMVQRSSVAVAALSVITVFALLVASLVWLLLWLRSRVLRRDLRAPFVPVQLQQHGHGSSGGAERWLASVPLAFVGVIRMPGRQVGVWFSYGAGGQHYFRLNRDGEIPLVLSGPVWVPAGAKQPRVVYAQGAQRLLVTYDMQLTRAR